MIAWHILKLINFRFHINWRRGKKKKRANTILVHGVRLCWNAVGSLEAAEAPFLKVGYVAGRDFFAIVNSHQKCRKIFLETGEIKGSAQSLNASLSLARFCQVKSIVYKRS